MIMNFGKYIGKDVADIPTDYLEWVLENVDDLSTRLTTAIEIELGVASSTGGTALAAPLVELVPSWYRTLAIEFHPDRGGSHDAMVAVNRAKELLVEMAGAEG